MHRGVGGKFAFLFTSPLDIELVTYSAKFKFIFIFNRIFFLIFKFLGFSQKFYGRHFGLNLGESFLAHLVWQKSYKNYKKYLNFTHIRLGHIENV